MWGSFLWTQLIFEGSWSAEGVGQRLAANRWHLATCCVLYLALVRGVFMNGIKKNYKVGRLKLGGLETPFSEAGMES